MQFLSERWSLQVISVLEASISWIWESNSFMSVEILLQLFASWTSWFCVIVVIALIWSWCNLYLETRRGLSISCSEASVSAGHESRIDEKGRPSQMLVLQMLVHSNWLETYDRPLKNNYAIKPKINTKWSHISVATINLSSPEVLLMPEFVKTILYCQLHCCPRHRVRRVFPHSINWQRPQTQY